MTNKPIPFSAPMVRALLDGRKTQTRRVLNPQPREWQAQVIDIGKPHFDEEQGGWGQWETEWDAPSWEMPLGQPAREVWRPLRVPYAPGDRLWVGEQHYALGHWVQDGPTKTGKPKWRFVRDVPYVHFDPPREFRTSRDKERPQLAQWYRRLGRFVFKKDSRITLTVTEVRVQRLQEISEADAVAEGITPYVSTCADDDTPAADAFMDIWNSLHGPDAWDANPWVVAITFTVQHGNIDEVTE